jgi:MFS family permease
LSMSGGGRLVSAATVLMTAAVMPAFLVGAAAPLIGQDFSFTPTALGATVAAFFIATSMLSVVGGRLSDRYGARSMLRVAAFGSLLSLLGIAATATSFERLLFWTVMGGAAAGVALPAASLAITTGAQLRPGLMFGWKQSAPPVASLLAGVAVPTIGLSIGWRWSFMGAATLPLIGAFLLPSCPSASATRPASGDGPALPYGALIPIAIGSAFSSAAALSMGGFLVSSAVDGGIAEGTAGVILAAGSVAGVSMRLLVGWRADFHAEGHLRAVAVMVAGGAIGHLVLAMQGGVSATLLGAILGYGLGYGWSGLLFFAVVNLSPQAPAAATGVVNMGATAGAGLGPVLFGFIAASSYRLAWASAAAVSVLAAALLMRASAPRLR